MSSDSLRQLTLALRRRMRRDGVTSKELALKSGVSPRSVTRILNGDTVTTDTALAVLHALLHPGELDRLVKTVAGADD